MNQAELIAKVASLSGESRLTTERVIKTAADVIAVTLRDGGEVALPGLGKLHAKDKAARAGRNPKTGEALTIAARRVPAFSAAKALKDALNV